MRFIKIMVSVIVLGFSCITNAQDTEISEGATAENMDKKSYYQKRAEEDAKYEQQLSAGTKAEEEAFWEEQKAYEADLKRKDKKAYRAYMKGKKDAYAEHYGHCDHHCHHSDHYYRHASFYYYRYDGHYYEPYPSSRTSIGTNVRVGTPSVRLGLF